MNTSFRVLLVIGSSRHPSHTRTLSESVEKALIGRGATTTTWDLGQRPLPPADPRFHEDPDGHEDADVRELSARAHEADAFVLSSPLYHNSFSGILKNLLDNLAIAHFHYKPVGLLGHGGHRSTQAVDALRVVTRGLLGVATPTQICTRDDDYRAAPDGYVLQDPSITARVERFADELALFAVALRVVRAGGAPR